MTARQPVPRVRLILLGAVDRGDDAVGPLAVAKLPQELWPLVEISAAALAGHRRPG